jgi:Lipopolysaccharide-assembly
VTLRRSYTLLLNSKSKRASGHPERSLTRAAQQRLSTHYSRPALAASLAAWLALFSAACGYHTGGKADTMPQSMKTIAVLPFRNITTRYKLSDRLQQAIVQEFISRTRFQVVNNPDEADAVLNGAISQALYIPIVFDPASGKATEIQVSVVLQLFLKDRRTGKILYSRPAFTVQNNYEVANSSNVGLAEHEYFDESSASLGRLSRDVARSVVSGILEDF